MLRLPILLFCFCFIAVSCSKDSVTSANSLETKIAGNWQVVDVVGDKIAVEWGLFYVATVQINADHTFGVDGGKAGTWTMHWGKVIFNTDIVDNGDHRTSTDVFSVSFSATNQLVLTNAQSTFLHDRLTN